jgi:hypothetical protein
MAGPNPLIQLGFLNRVKASVKFSTLPQFNITAPVLGRDGISMAIEGNMTEMLEQMVGMVPSQNVYLPATITAAIVKTTPLANLLKAQWESNSLLGDATIRVDATQLAPFQFTNCSIENFGGMSANGSSATYNLLIKGTYYVNSSLFT